MPAAAAAAERVMSSNLGETDAQSDPQIACCLWGIKKVCGGEAEAERGVPGFWLDEWKGGRC